MKVDSSDTCLPTYFYRISHITLFDILYIDEDDGYAAVLAYFFSFFSHPYFFFFFFLKTKEKCDKSRHFAETVILLRGY